MFIHKCMMLHPYICHRYLADRYDLISLSITKYETSKYLIYPPTTMVRWRSSGCISFQMRCNMMTSSNENIFRVTGLCAENSPVTGEFPSQRPVTRSFDAFFDLHLNERLSKQSRRRWFETQLCSFWRHCNVGCNLQKSYGHMCRTGCLYFGPNIIITIRIAVITISEPYIWMVQWLASHLHQLGIHWSRR